MLSLDDTLSQWFSDYPRGNEITIRHLLQHRSGIYDVTLDDAVFQGFVLTNMAVWLEPAEILRWTYDSTLPLITSISQGVEIPREAANAPGEGYHYSQPGFIALGYIVEHVTGQTLTEVYAERIFTPLQMTRSFMVGRDTPSTPITYVYLAQQFGNSLVPTTLFGSFDGIASASFSAGGVVSTTNDLMLFFSALMNGELLSEESMQAMQAFEVSDPEGYGITKVGYYGLGFARQIRDGYNMRGHNGSMPGSGSVMQYVEEYDLYITATRNTDAYPATHPDFVDFGMNDLVNNIVTAVRD
jgi:D-alanyl-D-alanine carboxypeptidase